MKKLILTAASFLQLQYSTAQVWRPMQNQYQARYVVYITKDSTQADIIAYQVDLEYQVLRPGLVYLAPVWYRRGTPIYITNDSTKADIVLYWTKSKSKARWKR
jgi:hypothetical protein